MQDEGKEPPEESQTEMSGGVDIEAGRDVQIGGDVVGRDKVTVESGGVHVGAGGRLQQTIVNLPRAVQVGIGVAVLAIVALAVVIIANQPAPVSVNTHFVFDSSEAMADPERLQIARSVLGNQATYATRRERLGLRIAGGGCEVPRDPDVPLGADQADRIVEAMEGVQPGGEIALVESIRAAADDLPPDPQAQNTNTIILVSAGQDMCLPDPCPAMASVAQSLERASIDFQLEIVALKPDDQTRQQLTCLARANVNGRFHEADSVSDLRTILQEIEPAEAVPGVQNGSFESGDAEAWSGEGIEVVAVEDANVPDVGQYAAQMKPGQALEQSAKVPGVGQPQLTVWYRAPGEMAGGVLNIYVNDQLEYTDDNPADRTGKFVAAEAPDWLVAIVNAEGFAGQEVTLRIEYVEAASRAGGVLRSLARQVDEALWVDNVAFVAAQSLPAMVETAPAPPATPTLTPTPKPDVSQTPTPARTTTATPTPPVSATGTLTRTVTAQPLSFTWRAGAFRESGRNDQGIGIWAQEIFVEARGGVPPYTILFDNAPKSTVPFDVFGLFCIGQVGTITVRSADGQTASERVTIPAPLCPTKTPTPTATHTPTRPPSPPTVVNGSFEEPAVSPGTYSFFGSIPGWSLSFGSSFEVHNDDTFYGLSAASGAQLVELDSDGSSGIYQDLPTTRGATYVLHFAFGARPEFGPEDNVLEVWWDGARLAGPLSLDGSELSTASWTNYTYLATATRSTTRLEFRDVGISNTYGTLLDDVYMTMP